MAQLLRGRYLKKKKKGLLLTYAYSGSEDFCIQALMGVKLHSFFWKFNHILQSVLQWLCKKPGEIFLLYPCAAIG